MNEETKEYYRRLDERTANGGPGTRPNALDDRDPDLDLYLIGLKKDMDAARRAAAGKQSVPPGSPS